MISVIFGGVQLSNSIYYHNLANTHRANYELKVDELKTCSLNKETLKNQLKVANDATNKLKTESDARDLAANRILQLRTKDLIKAENRASEILNTKPISNEFCEQAKQADQLILDTYK